MKEDKGGEAAQWLWERNRGEVSGGGLGRVDLLGEVPPLFFNPSGLLVPASFLQNLERMPGFLVLRSFQLFCSRREWGFWV